MLNKDINFKIPENFLEPKNIKEIIKDINYSREQQNDDLKEKILHLQMADIKIDGIIYLII